MALAQTLTNAKNDALKIKQNDKNLNNNPKTNDKIKPNANLNTEAQKQKQRALEKFNKQMDEIDLKINQLKDQKNALELNLADPIIYQNTKQTQEIFNQISKINLEIAQKTIIWEKYFNEYTQLENK